MTTLLTVPRRVERILESLGADPAFCHDVIGDLREEFSIRSAWDGHRAARRWYYHESLRVAPHLLRSWLRGLGWRDAFRMGEVIVWSILSVVVFQSLEGTFATRLARLLDVPLGQVLGLGLGLSRFQILLVWNSMSAFTAGYFAASISRRARVPGSLALAAFWAAFISIAWAVAPVFPTWFATANFILCVGNTVLGGVVRASRLETVAPEILPRA
jgi:hypothetical protein